MMSKFLIAGGFVILLVGAAFLYFFLTKPLPVREAETPKLMIERITITTSDAKIITGDYSGKAGERAVLLLHMMPAVRASWQQFSEKLDAAGFQTLAIDLRGHGESSGGPDGYKKFSDEEHQSSIHDVEAGAGFLKSRNPAKIFIAGASIGANLALQYAAEHKDIAGIILLSPGLDYRGLKTESYAGRLRSGQAVYYAAGRDDIYSADTVDALFRNTPRDVKKEIKIFERAGHGTNIFGKEPALMEELIVWLKTLK